MFQLSKGSMLVYLKWSKNLRSKKCKTMELRGAHLAKLKQDWMKNGNLKASCMQTYSTLNRFCGNRLHNFMGLMKGSLVNTYMCNKKVSIQELFF